MHNLNDNEKYFLAIEAKCELARRSFWHYCQLVDPDFYRREREYLFILCSTLEALYENRIRRSTPENSWIILDGLTDELIHQFPFVCKKLMINMPPQHGKSRTLVNFCDWIFGKDKEERIITASYNDDAAGDFAKYTRDGISEKKNTLEQIVFSDIFHDVRLKFGSKSYYKWALEGQHFNYLGAGVGGSITGKGGSILIVDDPIKSAEIALNEDALDKIWTWYTGTFLSRVSAKNGEPLEIFNMTRWTTKDPCGRILDGPEKNEWYVVKFLAYNKERDEMLCPSLLSKSRYESLKRTMITEIFEANYNQECIDLKGRLYQSFKTYIDTPKDDNGKSLFEGIKNYTDTADEGDDYLCSISYGVYKGDAYVLDLIYTKEPMEITEPATAKMLFENNVREARIESNNGGRGFARAVERILRENYHSKSCFIKWFYQSEKKRSRILTNSPTVMNNIFYPVNWKDKWPDYYDAMYSYQKEGKNAHDDAEDATTGIAEALSGKKKITAGKRVL